MKRFLSLITLIVVVVLLAGCAPIISVSGSQGIRGSGKFVEKPFDIQGFTMVEVAYGAHVTIARGDAYSVVVKVDDNAVDHLQVEKQGTSLFIGMKPGSYQNVTLRATVTMPELTGAAASGGATVKFDEFKTAEGLVFTASGGADITGKITGGNTTVEASGGADIRLDGQGGNLKLTHSGGGKTDLGGFVVKDAVVNVSGGSQSTINASGKVTGDVNGGGSVRVKGNATVDVKTSGGGQVTR